MRNTLWDGPIGDPSGGVRPGGRIYQDPISIIGGVGSALLGSDSADSAADAQRDATRTSDATQRYFYDTTRADNMPFLQTGYSANDLISMLLGAPSGGSYQPVYGTNTTTTPAVSGITRQRGLERLIGRSLQGTTTTTPTITGYQYTGGTNQSSNPLYGLLTKQFTGADLQNDPGYQFQLNQGLKSVQGSAAARGGLYSGATMKALNDYAQGRASTSYGDAFNRFEQGRTNLLNNLLAVRGGGQSAAGQVGAAGQNAANQISNNATALGNAVGASKIAQGNSWTNALNGGISALGGMNSTNKGALSNWLNGYSNSDVYWN